jgi:hypothetical protein
MPPGRNPRVVSYVEREPSFIRRVLRRLLSAPVIIPVVFIGAAVLGILIYYWTIFSGRIDNLLAGEVFTRSAGIYAAPKQLRVNETISQADGPAAAAKARSVSVEAPVRHPRESGCPGATARRLPWIRAFPKMTIQSTAAAL